MVVNCAALPRLIESELFGHERGAFTGADWNGAAGSSSRMAERCFSTRSASSAELQPKLLRVLEEGELERVGGTDTSPSTCASWRPPTGPDAEMEGGRFREDLFFRVAVYPITVPPLRDRRDDIPLLVEHFVGHFAQRRGCGSTRSRPSDAPPPGLPLAWQRARAAEVIERAVLTSTRQVLQWPSHWRATPM